MMKEGFVSKNDAVLHGEGNPSLGKQQDSDSVSGFEW
jgi:hypothetical protein